MLITMGSIVIFLQEQSENTDRNIELKPTVLFPNSFRNYYYMVLPQTFTTIHCISTMQSFKSYLVTNNFAEQKMSWGNGGNSINFTGMLDINLFLLRRVSCA